MCGIAGELFRGEFRDHGFTKAACAELTHRGPDESGFYDGPELSVGMCRLKVVGLDGGTQPAFSADRSVVCVANGEIYNHRDLRALLTKHGRRVPGTSDIHVIPELYALFGEGFVEYLHGMFAIALYDGRTRELHLVTDRVGKKPVFYAETADGRLAFASELAPLVQHPAVDRQIDPDAVDQYLSYRVIPAPHTIYQHVRKLTPGTMLTVPVEGKPRLRRYWQFDFSQPEHGLTTEQAAAEVDALLTAAVADRLESEVPLGSMLSGGLDSSLVVAIASRMGLERLNTFSVGFDVAAFDESEHARTVARYCGTTHHSYRITAEDALAAIDPIVRHMGEPYAFPSAIASYHMFRLARREVTVVLTGDGSDEIFCGYNRYKILQRLPDVAEADLAKVDIDALTTGGEDLAGRYQAVLVDGVQTSLKSRLYRPDFLRALSRPFPVNYLRERLAGTEGYAYRLNRAMQVDCAFWLPDAQLVKIDRMAMAHSVEPRSPFLDHRLIDRATRIPPTLKLVGDDEKAVLKAVAARYLPPAIIHRRKQELAVPLEQWLGTSLRPLIQATLLTEAALSRRYFQPDIIRPLVEEFRPEHSYAIWTLFMLERWHQVHVDGTALPLDEHAADFPELVTNARRTP
jgi:asparagine synthase (glutamine-hydrolysing)